MTNKVLIIEDDAVLRASIVQTLELEDFEAISTGSFVQARRSIRSNFDGVILSDIKMPDADGFDVLRFAQGLDTDLPVVLMTGHSDVPTAMRAIREGAYDYLEKPCETSTLVDTIRRALEHRTLVLSNRNLARQLDRSDLAAQNFPGQSQTSQELRDRLRTCAASEAPVHIWGETGVGKRTAAFVIHALSGTGKEFEAFNCETAKAKDLSRIDLNRDLTVSIKNVQAADPALLHSLQQEFAQRREIRVITTADCRFIELGLEWGISRPIEIYVPTLTERADDLREIFEAVLRQTARTSGKDMPVITPEHDQLLLRQKWTENLIAMRRFVSGFLEQPPEARPATLNERMDSFEMSVISDALRSTAGNVAQTAKDLGVPRNTLYDRMARFNLSAKDFRK